MLRFAPIAALSLAVGMAACTAPESERTEPVTESDTASATSTQPALVPTLQIEQYTDSVRLYLRVTNASAEPIELTFPTGQSFDFVVQDGDREVWRWSADMMFTQAIHTETLAVGETRAYEGTWELPPELEGDFVVRGILTAQEHRVEQEAVVTIP